MYLIKHLQIFPCKNYKSLRLLLITPQHVVTSSWWHASPPSVVSSTVRSSGNGELKQSICSFLLRLKQFELSAVILPLFHHPLTSLQWTIKLFSWCLFSGSTCSKNNRLRRKQPCAELFRSRDSNLNRSIYQHRATLFRLELLSHLLLHWCFTLVDFVLGCNNLTLLY